jgi:hypothetical protein
MRGVHMSDVSGYGRRNAGVEPFIREGRLSARRGFRMPKAVTRRKRCLSGVVGFNKCMPGMTFIKASKLLHKHY